MGFSLKKISIKGIGKALKKVQPGKIVGAVVTAAGGGAIVRAVDSTINAVKSQISSIKAEAKATGVAPINIAADRTNAALDASARAQAAAEAGRKYGPLLLLAGGAVVLFLLLRRR